MDDGPVISILLVGDADVGKSTFFARLVQGIEVAPRKPLRQVQDLNQPFVFNIWNKSQTYRLEFNDTASPENYTLLRPDFIVLCYSIANRQSLRSAQERWKYQIETHFNYDEALPVMLLGLKRDLRREDDAAVVFPQEGLRVAQEMRCDRYAECSAVTGELCKQVFEDIIQVAVETTTASRGKTPGTICTIL